MDILQQITAKKQQRLSAAQSNISLETLYRRLETEAPLRRPCPLASDSFEVIAEVKRASPSLGRIKWQHSLPDLVNHYQQGGAGMISVLTEEDFFLGSLDDLRAVRKQTNLPILRKDFLWTEYQLVESRLQGADVVLLITALLETKPLSRLLGLANQLELDVLVECHDGIEVERALEAGARIIGINNRNLKTFEVSLETTFTLCRMIPPGYVIVSESGIHRPEDAALVAGAGVNAVLVGESCLRQADPTSYVAELTDHGRQARQDPRNCNIELS